VRSLCAALLKLPAMVELDNSKYAVGWIAALSHERAAAEAMLDEKHAPPRHKHSSDHNTYTLGSIAGRNGNHNVVIASLPSGRYGLTSAAAAATQMLSSFEAIKFGLMVGIGGGVPSTDNDIRLGDVVVSKPEGSFGGVRQYDFGKATVRGFVERGALNSPPRVLLNAMGALESEHEMIGSAIPGILEEMSKKYPLMVNPRKGPGYVHQGARNDRLFDPDYEHPDGQRSCSECGGGEVMRPERPDTDPYIHYGTIASGNEVIKDARTRDLLADNCLCFETEAAGLVNDFPCLFIRGICDYCDSHKNDQWQKYAAATAAAYAKELLRVTDVADIQRTPEAVQVMREGQPRHPYVSIFSGIQSDDVIAEARGNMLLA
jgi:nucleoside phosphorylase